MIRSKNCFKCNAVKPLSEFYKHPAMPDGHVNKCKECNKLDVRENRKNKIDHYREYDKKRSNIPKRIVARKEYAKTENGIKALKRGMENYVSNYPYKKFAHTAISNAIRDGKVTRPENCEECGLPKKLHAHHDDYSQPYAIRWLCVLCHTLWHKENKAKYPF